MMLQLLELDSRKKIVTGTIPTDERNGNHEVDIPQPRSVRLTIPVELSCR